MKTRQKILKTILHRGAMSRTQLSLELDISPSRISEVTGLMIDEGLLIKSGYSDGSSRGRKNTLLDIDVSRSFALGVGLCRGILCAGITTVRGETLESKSMALDASNTPEKAIATKELCRELMKNCCLLPEQLLGIGICLDKESEEALRKEIAAAMQTSPLPMLIEPADEYLEYSSAYIPIDPTEMYMFGCAKIIRDVFLGVEQ